MSKSQHKSIVVFGPQGSGKSETLCIQLCKHFQLDKVIYLHAYPADRPLPSTGALVISDFAPPTEQVRRQLHIDTARKLLNRPARYPF